MLEAETKALAERLVGDLAAASSAVTSFYFIEGWAERRSIGYLGPRCCHHPGCVFALQASETKRTLGYVDNRLDHLAAKYEVCESSCHCSLRLACSSTQGLCTSGCCALSGALSLVPRDTSLMSS